MSIAKRYAFRPKAEETPGAKRYALRRGNAEDYFEGAEVYEATLEQLQEVARWVLEETGAPRHDWDAIYNGWDPSEYFWQDSACVQLAEERLLEGYPEGSFLGDSTSILADLLWPEFEGWEEAMAEEPEE